MLLFWRSPGLTQNDHQRSPNAQIGWSMVVTRGHNSREKNKSDDIFGGLGEESRGVQGSGDQGKVRYARNFG